MTQPRQVRRTARFLTAAKNLYPPGGSADGTPSFELFEAGPLKGAETQFALAFDDLPAAIDGVAIKAVITHGVPIFPAMVFYGMLATDGAVDLIDVTIDPDYFDQIADDPND